ncbi:hypothetical protein [Clostridium beijerinckii]|uniref:hypothetical protein n=1 Tax=Clostridium beijerinckii TaxID=1520 RepID=UPI0006BB516E|nr:hypothetical protein [Clostridium beijerinckii]ALB46196.1 hypothetical protein X276_13585 [Clostridium beijerinckii NRRL B-598]
MSSLIINKLYIFSPHEKKSKTVDFKAGKNIITSSQKNGSKRGKSTLTKSIYYALGADCFFDDEWNINDKIYIVDFTISNTSYYIFRWDRLFKVYSKDNFKELFKTNLRNELAKYLKTIFKFSVELPNKETENLEVTPPAFNYLLNYIDQDKIDGTNFNSFKNLSQYSDYKENVLYYHFNVYNEEYYNSIKSIEKLSDKKKELQNRVKLNKGMIDKINKNTNNIDYSVDIDNLIIELDDSKAEYRKIIDILNRIKKGLIKLRNEKEDLLVELKDLEIFNKNCEKNVKQLNRHKCPHCNSEIQDTLDEKIKRYNEIDDILYLKYEIEDSILKIERKIELEEKKYKDELVNLNEYESRLKINSKDINDIIKYKGFIEIKNSLYSEIEIDNAEITEIDESIKNLNRIKSSYAVKKSSVNKRYSELMKKDKEYFGLKEINENNFSNIKNVFTAGGSNKPIVTIMWYMNLLKLKAEFNSEAIKFPLILDSPNNVESDDDKKKTLFNYLFKEIQPNTQLIISTLGFKQSDYKEFKFENIVELTNDKYKMLSADEYNKYKEFLNKFI